MAVHWKILWNTCALFLVSLLTVSLVLSSPATQGRSRSYNIEFNRQPRTLNLTMGMNMLKDMLQNGMAYRPVPPPFPSLKNLFKTNGTQLTWVPLGSLMFNHNGKIISG